MEEAVQVNKELATVEFKSKFVELPEHIDLLLASTRGMGKIVMSTSTESPKQLVLVCFAVILYVSVCMVEPVL
jgi:hypothetical protein